MNNMTIIYTTEGIKITHPSGAIQILHIKDLQRIKDLFNRQKSSMVDRVTAIDAHIQNVRKAVEK